jgi:hypothetical protein
MINAGNSIAQEVRWIGAVAKRIEQVSIAVQPIPMIACAGRRGHHPGSNECGTCAKYGERQKLDTHTDQRVVTEVYHEQGAIPQEDAKRHESEEDNEHE